MTFFAREESTDIHSILNKILSFLDDYTHDSDMVLLRL